MRGRMDDRESYATLQVGDVMVGDSVARVLVLNHPDYAEVDVVLALTGWRTHSLSNGIAEPGQESRFFQPEVGHVEHSETGRNRRNGGSNLRRRVPQRPDSLRMVACGSLASRSLVKLRWSRLASGSLVG
jgi:hypothetical protein